MKERNAREAVFWKTQFSVISAPRIACTIEHFYFKSSVFCQGQTKTFHFCFVETFRNDAIDGIKKLRRKIFREFIACWLSRSGLIMHHQIIVWRFHRSSFRRISRWTQIAEDSQQPTTFPNRSSSSSALFISKNTEIFLLCSLFCWLSKCGCSAMNKKFEKLLSFIAKILDVWKNLKAIKILAVREKSDADVDGREFLLQNGTRAWVGSIAEQLNSRTESSKLVLCTASHYGSKKSRLRHRAP